MQHSGQKEEKVRDLEIMPVSDSELPQELQMLIAQKTSAPFKMTYSTDENLYITVGYGPQEGGGYSISVNELYLTGNSIVIDTELKGPETRRKYRNRKLQSVYCGKNRTFGTAGCVPVKMLQFSHDCN